MIGISDLQVNCTCGACPEQYEVFYNGFQVGYMRFRWGMFRVDAIEPGGDTIYSWDSGEPMQGCGLPVEQYEAGLEAIVDWLLENPLY